MKWPDTVDAAVKDEKWAIEKDVLIHLPGAGFRREAMTEQQRNERSDYKEKKYSTYEWNPEEKAFVPGDVLVPHLGAGLTRERMTPQEREERSDYKEKKYSTYEWNPEHKAFVPDNLRVLLRMHKQSKSAEEARQHGGMT